MAGKKGMKHYPLATKLEAVRLDAEEGKSYQEIAAQLRIGDRKRVEKWLRCQHRREMSTNHRFKKSTFKRQSCPVGFVKLPGAPPFPPSWENVPTALLCVFLSAGNSRL